MPNGTFRQLSHDDYVKGPDGAQVLLPKGTFVQVTTIGRHRSTELWGEDANQFNPDRAFRGAELWGDSGGDSGASGQHFAAWNPATERFSPFTYPPRDCIGKREKHIATDDGCGSPLLLL